jgi:hypothetical protein
MLAGSAMMSFVRKSAFRSARLRKPYAIWRNICPRAVFAGYLL